MVPWVIAVVAGCVPPNTAHCQVDPDKPGNGLLAGFSSRGVEGDPQLHPTLTAPGASIVVPIVPSAFVPIFLTGPNDISCNEQIHERSTADAAYYACGYGTSFSAPHVAGTVALMQQAAGGRLRPDQIKNILVRTARPMYKADGTPYEEWEVGAGYLDVYAAVQEAARR